MATSIQTSQMNLSLKCLYLGLNFFCSMYSCITATLAPNDSQIQFVFISFFKAFAVFHCYDDI